MLPESKRNYSITRKKNSQRPFTRLPSTKVGSAAAGRDDKKVEKYSNLSDNYHFVPWNLWHLQSLRYQASQEDRQ